MIEYLVLLLIVIIVFGTAGLMVRLGFHQRLPLVAKRGLSIECIPEDAARAHGDRVLFKLEKPLGWEIEALKTRYADPTVWSARRVLKTVNYLAGLLERAGVQPNDRVAIVKRNNLDIFLFSLAAIRVGAIAAPINAGLSPKVMASYTKLIAPKVAVIDVDLFATFQHAVQAEQVIVDDPDHHPGSVPCADGRALIALQQALSAAVPVERAIQRGLDDPLFVVHTSGTTGTPKAVILSNRGMVQSLRATLVFNLVSRRDHVYLALPFNHQVSNLYLHAILLLGMTATCCAVFDPRHTLNRLSKGDITIYFGFPITYTQMLNEGIEIRNLRSIRLWGTTADASHEVHQRSFAKKGGFFRHLGIPVDGSLFIDGLGSSEVGIAALLRIVFPWTTRFGRRVGRPVPFGPQVKIVDQAGRPVPRGCVGRFMIKGRCMFAGYWNAHEKYYGATRDGWWFTGDLVYQDVDGEYVHVDREVDAITHKHGVSYTLPIEEVVLRHPAIYDVCVFAVPASDGDNRPGAAIALRADAGDVDAERLRQELNAHLAPQDQLYSLRIVPWSRFPIGVTGKVLKRGFREQELQTVPG